MRTVTPLILVVSSLICANCGLKNDSFLLSQAYEGYWQVFHEDGQQKYSAFPKLEVNQGIASIYFSQFQKKSNQVEGIQIWLLMPNYYDQKVIKILIQFSETNRKQVKQNWQGESNHKYQIYENAKKSDEGTVLIKYFIDDTVIILSFDQKYSVAISYIEKHMKPNTSFFFAILAFSFLLILRRKQKVQETHIKHQSIPIILSVMMTFLVSCCEIVIGVRSLFGIMSPEAFFTVSGIINLAICYQIFRFYWALLIRKQVWIIAVWVFSSIYIWLLLWLRQSNICLLINSLIFIPEIGYHALKGKKIQRDLRFIFLAVYGQLYVLYFKACPNNIFKQSPSYLLSYSIPSILIVQIGIILGQISWGSRFFIPSALLPFQHNYYDTKNVKQATKDGNECHICLEQIKFDSKTKSKVMVTPCKHIFHASCLQKWMLVQMKCPVDRSDLPAF